MKRKAKRKAWKKLRPIKAGWGGCLNCSAQPATLSMKAIIAVGFGNASITKDRATIYREDPSCDKPFMTVAKAERMAAKDPDHDWRIHLVAPLSERHYQRQGDKTWVLYKRGLGFA